MSAESLKLGSLVPGGLPAGESKTLMGAPIGPSMGMTGTLLGSRSEFMPGNPGGAGIEDRRLDDPVLVEMNKKGDRQPPGGPFAAPWRLPLEPTKTARGLGYEDIPGSPPPGVVLADRMRQIQRSR